MAVLARLGIAILAAFTAACAGSHYDTWRERHPGWIDTFPDPGTSLHETLAGLQAPRDAGPSLEVRRLDVLRLSDSEAEPMGDEEIEAALAAESDGHFGIVATLACTSEADGERVEGEKVAWMLLVDGELRAYELPEFSYRCRARTNFIPALQEHELLERQITGYRNASFPETPGPIAEWYEKGIAYVAVGRIEDAKWALDRGDAAAHITDRRRAMDPSEQTPPDPEVVGDAELQATRDALLQSLEAVHSEVAVGQPVEF